MSEFHATTILAVSHRGSVVFAGDGQVTVSNTIMKHGAQKIRRLRDGQILAGFAGSAADAFALFERFDSKLSEHDGKLARACVELAKDWRLDKYLRNLQAMLVVGSYSEMYLLSGSGDVIQPDDGILGIGSGGNFALSAARGIVRAAGDSVTAREIAETAMSIASEICPFTNNQCVFEEISK